MNANFKKAIVFMGIAALLIASMPAYAEHGGMYGSRKGKTIVCPHCNKEIKPEDMCSSMDKELGLTQEQQDKLKSLREAHRTQMDQICQALKEKEENLRQALDSATSDTAVINSIAAEVKSLQAQKVDGRVANILQTKAILTSEQFDKFTEMCSNMKGKKGKMGKMGKGGECGMGMSGEQN
ncbi:MAG: periplasmic heavy metal sensor [Candidatus Omnitrophota bacterium]